MKKLLKNFLLIALFLLIIAAFFSISTTSTEKPEKISFSELVKQIKQEIVKKIEIEENKLNITLTDEKREIVYRETSDSLVGMFRDYEIPSEKIEKINIAVKESGGITFWMGIILPFLVPF